MKFFLPYNHTECLNNKSLSNSIVSNYTTVFRHNQGNIEKRGQEAYCIVFQSRPSASFYTSFILFNFLFTYKYVLSNCYIPGTVQVAEAEIVNNIDKTPVFMKRQNRQDNDNGTLSNR